MTNAHYPTPQHERAAAEITSFFKHQADTQAVLLTNSCARGKATPDSCLDMQVLTQTERVAGLDQAWRRFAAGSAAIAELNARAHRLLREILVEPAPLRHPREQLVARAVEAAPHIDADAHAVDLALRYRRQIDARRFVGAKRGLPLSIYASPRVG